jgi:hypothetical protein
MTAVYAAIAAFCLARGYTPAQGDRIYRTLATQHLPTTVGEMMRQLEWAAQEATGAYREVSGDGAME